jgi:hypothetical protein
MNRAQAARIGGRHLMGELLANAIAEIKDGR